MSPNGKGVFVRKRLKEAWWQGPRADEQKSHKRPTFGDE